MKSLMLGAAASLLISGQAFADSETSIQLEQINVGAYPSIVGSIELEIAENDAGDYAAITTIDAGIVTNGFTFGEIGVESIDGDAFELNKWYFGAAVGQVAVSFGDHGDAFGDNDDGIFVESYSDYSNIFEPTVEEALIVTTGPVGLAVGFTDISTDITDLSNVQAAYTSDFDFAKIATSADYNVDSEDYAVAARVSGFDVWSVELGSTVSYGSATDTFAYEADGTAMGVTAYINGDQDDMMQNIGAGYERGFGSIALASDLNYNIDDEELSPTVTVTFSF